MTEARVLDALLDREPIFHRRHHGTSRAALEAMTAPDFFEIGASGRVYERAEVIAICLRRYEAPETFDGAVSRPRLRRIGEDLWQLTYVLTEPGRVSRRSTLWRQGAEGWQIVFHQGTLV